MKRSDLLMKVVTLVVFIAIVAYAGYSIYETNNDPLKTVMAIHWDVTNSVATEGYAVRDEKVLSASSESVYVLAEDGAKVSAGGTVAMIYNGTDAIERAEKMRGLRLEIEQLKSIKGENAESHSGKDSVLNLASVIAGGNLEYLDQAAMEVELNVFSEVGKYSDDELKEKIDQLQSELDELTSKEDSGTEEIYTDVAGTFSSGVDGYENIGSETILSIKPSEFDTFWAQSKVLRNDSFGKMISGIKWYYVTCVDAEAIKALEIGDSAVLDFHKTYNETVTMTIENISREENGKCVVVFSSKKKLQDVADIREMTADIVFNRYSGIRVPKEAVHLDEDGKTFVYVLKGMQAHKATITIQAESGEYYLAVPDDGMLSEGVQIITKGLGVTDGKVVS